MNAQLQATATRWVDVAKKPEYLALPSNEKLEASKQYFQEVVAPQLPQEEYGPAWGQFYNEAVLPTFAPTQQANPALDFLGQVANTAIQTGSFGIVDRPDPTNEWAGALGGLVGGAIPVGGATLLGGFPAGIAAAAALGGGASIRDQYDEGRTDINIPRVLASTAAGGLGQFAGGRFGTTLIKDALINAGFNAGEVAGIQALEGMPTDMGQILKAAGIGVGATAGGRGAAALLSRRSKTQAPSQPTQEQAKSMLEQAEPPQRQVYSSDGMSDRALRRVANASKIGNADDVVKAAKSERGKLFESLLRLEAQNRQDTPQYDARRKAMKALDRFIEKPSKKGFVANVLPHTKEPSYVAPVAPAKPKPQRQIDIEALRAKEKADARNLKTPQEAARRIAQQEQAKQVQATLLKQPIGQLPAKPIQALPSMTPSQQAKVQARVKQGGTVLPPSQEVIYVKGKRLIPQPIRGNVQGKGYPQGSKSAEQAKANAVEREQATQDAQAFATVIKKADAVPDDASRLRAYKKLRTQAQNKLIADPTNTLAKQRLETIQGRIDAMTEMAKKAKVTAKQASQAEPVAKTVAKKVKATREQQRVDELPAQKVKIIKLKPIIKSDADLKRVLRPLKQKPEAVEKLIPKPKLSEDEIRYKSNEDFKGNTDEQIYTESIDTVFRREKGSVRPIEEQLDYLVDNDIINKQKNWADIKTRDEFDALLTEDYQGKSFDFEWDLLESQNRYGHKFYAVDDAMDDPRNPNTAKTETEAMLGYIKDTGKYNIIDNDASVLSTDQIAEGLQAYFKNEGFTVTLKGSSLSDSRYLRVYDDIRIGEGYSSFEDGYEIAIRNHTANSQHSVNGHELQIDSKTTPKDIVKAVAEIKKEIDEAINDRLSDKLRGGKFWAKQQPKPVESVAPKPKAKPQTAKAQAKTPPRPKPKNPLEVQRTPDQPMTPENAKVIGEVAMMNRLGYKVAENEKFAQAMREQDTALARAWLKQNEVTKELHSEVAYLDDLMRTRNFKIGELAYEKGFKDPALEAKFLAEKADRQRREALRPQRDDAIKKLMTVTDNVLLEKAGQTAKVAEPAKPVAKAEPKPAKTPKAKFIPQATDEGRLGTRYTTPNPNMTVRKQKNGNWVVETKQPDGKYGQGVRVADEATAKAYVAKADVLNKTAKVKAKIKDPINPAKIHANASKVDQLLPLVPDDKKPLVKAFGRAMADGKLVETNTFAEKFGLTVGDDPYQRLDYPYDVDLNPKTGDVLLRVVRQTDGQPRTRLVKEGQLGFVERKGVMQIPKDTEVKSEITSIKPSDKEVMYRPSYEPDADGKPQLVVKDRDGNIIGQVEAKSVPISGWLADRLTRPEPFEKADIRRAGEEIANMPDLRQVEEVMAKFPKAQRDALRKLVTGLRCQK